MSTKHQETRPEPQEKVPESPAPETEIAGESQNAENGTSAEAPSNEGSCDQEKDRATILEAELAAVREELSSVNDKYLRKLADDANFRKRMTREKEEGLRFAVGALLGDIIPILDDFDRAIASAEIQKDYTVLHDGVLLIKRQLGTVLETKYGLVRFESLGKPFDPHRHEAVAMVQGGLEDGDEAVVAEEFLPGYGLNDRVLRTAKVRVRMPAPASQSAPASQAAPQAAAAEAPDGAPSAENNAN